MVIHLALDKGKIGKKMIHYAAMMAVISLIAAALVMMYSTQYETVDATPLEAGDEPSYSTEEECAKKNNKGACMSQRTIHICMIEVKYSFTVDNTDYTGESSADIAEEVEVNSNSECLEKGSQWREDFLNSTTLKVYYNPSEPSDNHYMQPATPGENALMWGGGGLLVALILFFVGRDMVAKSGEEGQGDSEIQSVEHSESNLEVSGEQDSEEAKLE